MLYRSSLVVFTIYRLLHNCEMEKTLQRKVTRARTFFFPIPLSLEKLSTSFGAENIATTNKLQDVFAAVGSSAAQINFPHVRVG